MNVRNLKYGDLDELFRIHHEFYPKDAPPNFNKDFTVITDSEDHIITCGGIELMAEAIIVTSKNYSSHVRTSALLELLRSLMLTCGGSNYNFLHATVADGSSKPGSPYCLMDSSILPRLDLPITTPL